MESRKLVPTRSKTQYRGVTRVLNAKKDRSKYDVQFVFSDGGVKKHPKVYGFVSAAQASRAFDVLALKRFFEKVTYGSWKAAAEALREADVQQTLTNHGKGGYAADDGLMELIFSSSRDQLVYGLKEVSRRRSVFTKESMLHDLSSAMMLVDPLCKDLVARVCPEAYKKIKKELEIRHVSSAWGIGDRMGADMGMPRISYENQGSAPCGQHQEAVENGIKRKNQSTKSVEKGDGSKKRMRINSSSHGKDVKAKASIRRNSKDTEERMNRDGLRLLFDMCRLCGGSYPELRCCADLLYLWDKQHSTQSRDMDDGADTLNYPSYLYQDILNDMKGIIDLRKAMGYIWDSWSQGSLKKIWSQSASPGGFLDLGNKRKNAPLSMDLASLHSQNFGHHISFADMQNFQVEDHVSQHSDVVPPLIPVQYGARSEMEPIMKH